MEFGDMSMLHKIFIVIYNIIVIYGLFLDFRERDIKIDRINEKVKKEILTDVSFEISSDEKFMLNKLAKSNGYNSIESFIANTLYKKFNE